MSNVVAADVFPGDKVRTDNGESHQVEAVHKPYNGGVRIDFTCHCPALIVAYDTLVELVG